MASFKVTTTGTQNPVILNDLGGVYLPHPTSGKELLGEHTWDELFSSSDIKSFLDSGHITVQTDSSGVIASSSGLGLASNDHSILSHTDVNISSPSNGQLLRYNSSTQKWENFTRHIFGQEYQYRERTSSQTTTSTAFVNYDTMTMPTVSGGLYEFSWFYVWSHNGISSDFRCRVTVDGVAELIDPSGTTEHRQEPADVGGGGIGGTNQRVVASGSREISMSPSSNQDVDITFASSSAGLESTIYYANLSVKGPY